MQKVIELVMPIGARQTQARYLRRHLGKPSTMTVAGFIARLQVLNRYMKHLPGSNRTSLPEDELVEIIVAALPQKWTSELFRLQFKFEESNLAELKEKLERLELCERITGNAPD